MIEALRAAGVAKPDLQTTDVTVSPSWDNRGRQDGFTAHSSVQVKVASVSRAGAILDAAVAAGATETSGPSFDRSDRSQLYRNALKAAFADARGKAATLAGEAGASLGARAADRGVARRAGDAAVLRGEGLGHAGRARHDRGAGDGHRHVQPLVTGRPSCSHSLQEPG